MNQDIFVFVETYFQMIQPVSLELLSTAKQLIIDSHMSGEVYAVILGNDIKDLSQTLINHGAEHVIVIDQPELAHPFISPYAYIISDLIKSYDPNICLIGATPFGRELAPRIASTVRTGLTADATILAIEVENDHALLLATRPAFGGNLFGTIICPDHRPQMASVRPGVFKAQVYDHAQGDIITKKYVLDESLFDIIINKIVEQPTTSIDLTKADLVIGVGRGMKNHLPLIEEACLKLNASAGYSRAIIDEHLAPKDLQVGQTGKTIRPSVYIACGISGAVQHVAGMEHADYIIAINTDPNAAIFSVANLGIVADASKVLEELIKIV